MSIRTTSSVILLLARCWRSPFWLLIRRHVKGHGQDDRQKVIESLKTWAEDWESILRSIPLSERAAPPTSPAYKPRTYKGVDRSPYLFRQTKTQVAGRKGCRASPAGRDPSPESDDDRGETQMPGTPTPAQPKKAQRGPALRSRRDGSNTGSSSQSGRVSNRQYGTQKVPFWFGSWGCS